MNDTNNQMRLITDMADFDSHHYAGGGLILTRVGGKKRQIAMYQPMNVLVPRGEAPTISDIDDSDHEKLDMAYGLLNAERRSKGEPELAIPTKIVTYQRAILLTMGNNGDNTPELQPYKDKLHIYMADTEYKVIPKDIMPAPVARFLLDDNSIKGEDKMLTMKDAMKAAGIGLAALAGSKEGRKRVSGNEFLSKFAKQLGIKDQMPTGDPDFDKLVKEANRKHGEHVVVIDGDAIKDKSFAMVTAYRFTGNVGVATENGLATYNVLTIMAEPGATYKIMDLPADEQRYYTEMSDGVFNPTKVVMFEAAGMLETIGDRAGFALGEIPVLAEAGAQFTPENAWVPKAAFDKVGFTNYLAVRADEPTLADVKSIRNVPVGPTVVIEGSTLNS